MTREQLTTQVKSYDGWAPRLCAAGAVGDGPGDNDVSDLYVRVAQQGWPE